MRFPWVESAVVSADKTALVIVDMQNDFVRPNGKQYTGPSVTKTIGPIRTLLEKARSNTMRVIYTQSWHEPDCPRYSDPRAMATGKFRGSKAGTWGAEIIDELRPRENEPSVKKGSYDCWFGTNMESLLRSSRFGTFEHECVHRNRVMNDCQVIITGTVANVCVEKAVIGFYLRGYDVIVPIDCIASKTQLEIDWSIRQFKKVYLSKITKSSLVKLVPPTEDRIAEQKVHL